MSRVKIPATIGKAVAELGSIGRLVSAREWERAAIVAALVGPPQGAGARSDRSNSATVGIRELVNKRIVGLGSQHTIERYRDAWFNAGLPAPILGSNVSLPDLPWPPDEVHNRLGDGPRRHAVEVEADRLGVSRAAALRAAETSSGAMEAAIMADPKTFQTARAAVNKAEVANTMRKAEEEGIYLGPPPQSADGKALSARLQATNDAEQAISKRIYQAGIMLDEARKLWDSNVDWLSDEEKYQIHQCLRDIVVTAEALTLNVELARGLQND